jgi:SM-20-related protein
VDIIFEKLVNSFIENKVGIVENFLDESLAGHLKENLLLLFSKNKLIPAGIGNKSKLIHNTLVRSDKIYWLDREHNNKYENVFFDLMDTFVKYLNGICYAGITGYEFHYAVYEEGSFYKKHIDQFKDNKSRAYSMIIYLNENWEESHGGELCIYHANHSQIISPINRQCVFFKSSELEHEVLLSHKPRYSITGWLKTN